MVAFHQRCVKGSSGFLTSHGQIIEKDPDLVELVLKWCTEQVKGVKLLEAWALMGYCGLSSTLCKVAECE